MPHEKRVFAVRDNEGKVIAVLEIAFPHGIEPTGPREITAGGQVKPGTSLEEFVAEKKEELLRELDKFKV